MSSIKRLCLILALACLSSAACAQSMFKCTQADGRTAFQAEPCPDNASQQVMSANKRGVVKIVPPVTRSADSGADATQPGNAIQPTHARSSDAEKSNLPTVTDQVVDLRPQASADSSAGSSAPAPASASSASRGIAEQIILIIVFFCLFGGAIGSGWLMIETFRESIMWGIMCLVFSPLYLVFVVTHWERAKTPFLISVSSFVVPIIWIFFYELGHKPRPGLSEADGRKPGVYLVLAPTASTLA